MKHLNIKVTGKVQGVFYRDSTVEQARLLGITGIVKNLSDGSVYIQAEGDPQSLEELVQWCRSGPRMASVENVLVEEGDIQHFNSFEITF